MRFRLVHCPAAFATLVLPTLGKFITIFPLTLTHKEIQFKVKRKILFYFTVAKLISFLDNSKSFLRKVFKK